MKKLLKFSAEWCGPCHAVAPQVEKVAEEFGLEVVTIDIDHDPDIADQYEVRSVPTILLVEFDEDSQIIIGRHVGAAPKSQITSNLGLKAES